MKKLYIVPKGAFPIFQDADLATIRGRLQRWIDSSHNGSYLGLKPFTRRGFQEYQDPSQQNPQPKDIRFLKDILKARFSIASWFRQTTPTKFWMLCGAELTKYTAGNKLDEIMSYRGLGVKIIE